MEEQIKSTLTASAISSYINPMYVYKIMSLNSGKVLDVNQNSTADGEGVNQFDWNDGENQQWTFIPITPSSDNVSYEIQNVNSGKCLDIDRGSLDAGARLIQYQWHEGLNQKWKITPLDGSPSYIYKITCENSNLVLDVNNLSLDNNAVVQQWPWTGGLNQKWAIIPVKPFEPV